MAKAKRVEFRLEHYDFSNDANLPARARQGAKIAGMVQAGWERIETQLSDVYVAILWQRTSDEPEDEAEDG
jgi:hypothetical protein